MICDWCGEAFAEGERQFPGFDNLPTHAKCRRAAISSWNKDRGITYEGPPEREPFTDWPNGQGTYD
jgi:hypothetical protein